jgi:hypothetical protein
MEEEEEGEEQEGTSAGVVGVCFACVWDVCACASRV